MNDNYIEWVAKLAMERVKKYKFEISGNTLEEVKKDLVEKLTINIDSIENIMDILIKAHNYFLLYAMLDMSTKVDTKEEIMEA